MGLVFWVAMSLSCATPPRPAAPPVPPVEPTIPPAGPPTPAVEKDPFSIFPEQYSNRAMEYGKKGEWRKALQSWEIVKSFVPSDETVAKKIENLRTQINVLTDQHFKQGLTYYQKHSLPEARKEFLLALCYNPDHKEALEYLKQKLVGEDFTLYEVRKGDTLQKIAREKYHDSQMDFLIAYFNDLKKDAPITPPMTLKLPMIASAPIKQPIGSKEMSYEPKETPFDTREMLSKAQVYFKTKNYRETLSISENILEYDPANKEARDLMNESYYQMAKILNQGKKYQEALTMFNHVDPKYKDVKEWIPSVKNQLAEAHYLMGVKYYVNEELEKAVKEWEETLTLNPKHPKAKRDMENAFQLLKKLKEIK